MKENSADIIARAVKDYWKETYPQDVVVFFKQKYSFAALWEWCETLVECCGSSDYENMTFFNDFCEGQTEVKDVIIIPFNEMIEFYYKMKIKKEPGEV